MNQATVANLDTLYYVWDSIYSRHPDLPEVFLELRTDKPVRGHRVAAGFLAEPETTVLVTRGVFERPEDVLHSLLHEAAHALGWTRGIEDTSRRRRNYHLKAYAELAAEVGLELEERDPRLGFNFTILPDWTAMEYDEEITRLAQATLLLRGGDQS